MADQDSTVVRTEIVNGWSLAEVQGEREPRIGSLEIGRRLGYNRPRKIKEIIDRNRPELERYGSIPIRPTVGRIEKTGAIKGIEERVVHEPLLNADQALIVCMLSETAVAADVRFEIVQVMKAWREGRLASAPSAEMVKALVVETITDVLPKVVSAIVPQLVVALSASFDERMKAAFAEHVASTTLIGSRADKILSAVRGMAALHGKPGTKENRSAHRRICNTLRDSVGIGQRRAFRDLPERALGDLLSRLPQLRKEEEAATAHRRQLKLVVD